MNTPHLSGRKITRSSPEKVCPFWTVTRQKKARSRCERQKAHSEATKSQAMATKGSDGTIFLNGLFLGDVMRGDRKTSE